MASFLRSAPFQEEFCNYLLHTSIENVLIFFFLTLFISEIYKKYNIHFNNISQPFNGTYCNIDFKAEDIVNLMSVSYTKGHFIIGAEFNDTSFFEYYPDVGTTTGVCKTIKPMVLSFF